MTVQLALTRHRCTSFQCIFKLTTAVTGHRHLLSRIHKHKLWKIFTEVGRSGLAQLLGGATWVNDYYAERRLSSV